MKILNLYAGLGCNRQLWGGGHEITAVELDVNIAKIYKDLYPNDNVIVDDAHEYLREHFRDFDFIWASPPCPTHSVLQLTFESRGRKANYPDMRLYQEIILLQKFFKGKWVIENVKPYYTPLIPHSFVIDRHCFWSSDFLLSPGIKGNFTEIRDKVKEMERIYGVDLSKYKLDSKFKRQILRNCVIPEIGKYIFDQLTALLFMDKNQEESC